MAGPDLRGYLGEIEERGELRTIKTPVSPVYEIAGVTAWADGGPAILFENIKGSRFRLVSNLVGTRERFAAAVGAAGRDGIHEQMISAIKGADRPLLAEDPGMFASNSSRYLSDLPMVTHFEKEPGPFVTSSIIHVMNPETGRQNASFHRLMPIMDGDDPQKIRHCSVRMVEGRHLHRAFTDAQGQGEDLPVVVTVGVHPAVSIAAAYQAEWTESEMDIANMLLGGEMRVARVDDSELYVPADAEIVMKGRILCDRTHPEWMVEMLQTYDHERQQPVFELDSLYYRNNAIFYDVLSGYAEHRLLMGMPIESKLNVGLKDAFGRQQIGQVSMTNGGCNWLHAVVQARKQSQSDPGRIIKRTFELHRSLKQVTVVDEDIDPNNAEAVEYAMATRFQADRDLIVVENVRGSSLDPSSDQKNLKTAKMGIDATRPLSKRPEGFELARIPGIDRFRLEYYLD